MAYAATSEAVSVTLTGPDGQAREYASRPLPADFDRGLTFPVKDITEEVFGAPDGERAKELAASGPDAYPYTVSESRQFKSSQAREVQWGGSDGTND